MRQVVLDTETTGLEPEQGHRVICVDNLETGSLQNVEHIRDPDFVFLNHDMTAHISIGLHYQSHGWSPWMELHRVHFGGIALPAVQGVGAPSGGCQKK